jgi:hypothetical protein
MAEAIGIVFLKFKSNNLSNPEKPAIQDELFDIVTRYLTKSLVVEVSFKKQIKCEHLPDTYILYESSLKYQTER